MTPEPNSATLSNAPSQTALHGIYFKLSALVLFCTMDAMVKGLGATYGSFQLMVFRSAVALVPVAVLIWHAGGIRMAATEMHRVAGIEVLDQKRWHGDDLSVEGLHGHREPFGVLLAGEDRQIGVAAKLRSAV